MDSIKSNNLPERMRAAVSLSWEMFSQKVGNGLISINKEASMQLQYAYVLQQLVCLIKFHEDERFEIELETGVNVQEKQREIDILFKGTSRNLQHTIAIELKCYREIASSGGKRGATDIFMKDVYFDLYLLEQYILADIATEGVALVMNDLERLINPIRKDAKCWDYDISNGNKVEPGILRTPIGGRKIYIELKKYYEFNWKKYGNFWFLENQEIKIEKKV